MVSSPYNVGEKVTLIGKWGNESSTRTALQADGTSIWWTTGEEINVFCGVHMQGKFVSTNTEAAETVAFEGSFEPISGRSYNGTKDFLAVYPYNSENERPSARAVNISIPSQQIASKGGFSDHFFPAIAISDGLDLLFYNVGGGACFSLTTPGVESVTFTALNGEYLAGKVQVLIEDGFPKVSAVLKGQRQVTVSAPKGECFEVGERYYAVFAPQTLLKGLSVSIHKHAELASRKIDKEIVVNRSRFGLLTDIDKDLIFSLDIPKDEIWYYTIDGKTLELPSGPDFWDNLVSNTYENGVGVLKFKDALYTVGENAFLECTTLSKVILPNSITTIRNFAFSSCDVLESVHFPTDLTKIGKYAFNKCISLESISLPEGLKEIDSYAFYGCKSLADFTLPDQIETVGRGSFTFCNALTVVDLSNTKLTSIPEYMFNFCSSLERVIFPETLQSLEYGAFDYSGIKELILPEGFNGALGTAVCQGCENLTRVYLANAIEIGEMAFNGCYSLASLDIPESVINLGDSFISRCTSLREVTGRYVMDDHRSVSVNGTLMGFASGGAGNFSYVIPEGITKIGGGVFSDVTTLENVVFHEGVTTVGPMAFSRCSGLKEVSMSMVTEIESGVFSYCTSLEHVDLSDKINSIPRNFFEHCTSLKTVTIPEKVGWIGCLAFSGCTSLDTLYCVPVFPPRIDDLEGVLGIDEPGVFKDTPASMKLLIGEDAISQYSNDSFWKNYRNCFVPYSYPDRGEPDFYVSKDYSKDGEVTLLRKASEGAGINVVIMGDAFTDANISSGYYMETIRKAEAALFSEEPYKTFQHLFNVYAVTVVSATEGYEHSGRALNTSFGGGTLVRGNHGAVNSYAKKAVSEEDMENTLVIVLMNRRYYAGTCYMFYPRYEKDYSCGLSLAYLPLGTSDEMLRQLVTHEAGGHGFSKLADEYYYYAPCPDAVKNDYSSRFHLGWWNNIDFVSDPETVKWAQFIKDSRYAAEKIGVYEGACTYITGAWRPTDDSIMRNNVGGYNAPSRYAIWYRIHKLAYGDQWQGSYEAFVAYDAINRSALSGVSPRSVVHNPSADLPPLAPPVIIEHSWRDE